MGFIINQRVVLLPPTDALRLIILNTASILYIIVAGSTESVDAYSTDTVIASSLEKKVTTHEPSPSTRHCSVKLSPIAENSQLLALGVWAASQS